MIQSFKGEGFIGIKVVWKKFLYYIVNVYSLCILSKKKKLWGKFLELKEVFLNGEWIIGGDFNGFKHPSEREKVE